MGMNVFMIAAEVATELGEEWAAKVGAWGDDDAFLVGPDDMSVHVRRLADSPQLSIGGRLPDGWHDYAPSRYDSDAPRNPDINVTSKKTPAQIAGDITRRLLPGYTAYLDATRKRKADRDAHYDSVAAHGDRLILLSGGKAKWDDPNRGRYSGKTQPLTEISLRGVPGVSYGSVRIHGDGGVHFENVSLTPEGAEAFFRAMGKLTE